MAFPYGAYGYGTPMPGAQAPAMPMGAPGMGGPPPGGYGGYGQFPGGFGAPPVNDPMWGYFTAIAGQDGEIDSEELQRCLTQTGIHGTYSPFSLETCRLMISMLDRDLTGKMGFNEFKEVFAALSGWKQNFMMFDQDRSGSVEPHEMSQSLSSMGYRISPQALSGIIKRFSKNGRIYFDDYVACCIKLRALTDTFRRRDNMQQGFVNFSYDEFLLCTMTI
ncbi:sorcin [Polypterus senegalus]|uniref:sorcin n=1 Tax=Polypterus senegalus TaxID=55291 RepID=UPI001965E26E|nr:sorcin [Polypterus senegalus]